MNPGRFWFAVGLLFIIQAGLAPFALSAANSSVLLPDGVMRADGVMNPGSAVLMSASGTFTSADVGKYIQVIGAGPGGTTLADGVMVADSLTPNLLTSASATFKSTDVGRGIVIVGAGAGGGPLMTTIQGFNSKSSVILSAKAQASVAGNPVFYGYMTLESCILSVQSNTSVTLNDAASAPISSAVYAYGTNNQAAFQIAVDTVKRAAVLLLYPRQLTVRVAQSAAMY